MFLVSLIYNKVIIKLILRKNKNLEKIEEIKIVFKNQRLLRKNIFTCSPLYSVMKSYLYIIYTSLIYNLFIFALSYLVFLFYLSYFFLQSCNLVPKSSSTFETTIILFFVNIIFVIRYNSDTIKTTLDTNLLKKWKYIFLIVDILTMNLLSVIAVIKLRHINDNSYMQQKINLTQKKNNKYKSINFQYLFFYIVILLFILFVSSILFTIGFYYKIAYLIILSWFFFLCFLVSFPCFIAVVLPTLALSHFVMKKINKNKGSISISTCLWLIRYLGGALDINIAALFIQQFELHEILVASNLYCQI